MEAKYGQIAESKRINEAIYDCFVFLSETEQKKFVKKFKDLPHSEIQVMHTFHELLLGAYLSANGLIIEYDRKTGVKTPDWSIIDKSSNTVAIIETINHHLDRKTEDSIAAQRKAGENVLVYWPNSNDPYHQRIYSHIEEKACVYKDLVSEINIPYVVAIFIDYQAVIDADEVKECISGGDEPLFLRFRTLSGVIHYEEVDRGSYGFTFIQNPYAFRKFDIPSGYFNKH